MRVSSEATAAAAATGHCQRTSMHAHTVALGTVRIALLTLADDGRWILKDIY